MKTAVAVKMPACSPLSSSGDKTCDRSGANSAGRVLARKNTSSGPRSSVSFRPGLSWALAGMGRCLPCLLAVVIRAGGMREPGIHGVKMTASTVHPRNGLGEILGGKGREIVDALAHADEMHGQAVFVRDGDEDSAARGAVELGHREPGDAGDLAEHLDL